jgi:uncharacterized cupredoxin-like copper-binding protein
MTRSASATVPALLVSAVLSVALSGCMMTTGRQLAGPGMTTRMGQGSATCAQVAPRLGTRVDVLLMDMGRRSMMSGSSTGRMLRPAHTMPGMSHGWMRHGRMMLRAAPRVVPAGQVTFVAANAGSRIHELVVLPLGPHAAVGRRTVGSDRAVDESASLGEASRSCGAGEGHGLRPGTLGWTTIGLTPGRYELVCNRPGHYAHGMYAELVVR